MSHEVVNKYSLRTFFVEFAPRCTRKHLWIWHYLNLFVQSNSSLTKITSAYK